MWCAHCHTFWNWDTGRRVDVRRSLPHNPDHRQWVQTQDRELHDLPCGGFPDLIQARIPFLCLLTITTIVDAGNAIRHAQTLRARYPRQWNARRVNDSIRSALVHGRIDERKFAIAAERRERACHFKREIGRVMESTVYMGLDVLQRLNAQDTSVFQSVIEFQAIRRIANDGLARIGNVHRRHVPYLTDEWRWTRRPPCQEQRTR